MHAKKHLGQNFLRASGELKSIAEAAHLSENDIVLEIGPGKGALTKELLLRAKKVVAVEKDADLIGPLSLLFAQESGEGKFELHLGDILEEGLLEKLRLKAGKYKVVANIPYNITGSIIRLLLSGDRQPSSVTFIVQKEVAERIVCRDGKESILSLSVKAYGNPSYIKKVPARYFSPEPKVDSAIIHISTISRKNFDSLEQENLFFSIIKAGFAHKRKFLSNNLEVVFDKDTIKKLFLSCGISEKARAEDISFETWLHLLNIKD